MKKALATRFMALTALASGLTGVTIVGCGGSDDRTPVAPVSIDAGTPNTISSWDAAATATINVAPATTGTAEEMQPVYAVDLATVHVAMYDAVAAVDGHYTPFYVTPTSPAAGASADAAATAAAYAVLKGLFPSRTAQYQPTYDALVAAVPDGSAKTLGLALGAEVGAGVLAARAADGRSVVLAAFVPGTGPGQFRGPALVGRSYPSIRPFALTSAAQFRAPGPQPLTSAAYAADLNETEALGGSTSTTRTAEQATSARFHSEGPFTLWPRNLRPFTMTTGAKLVDQARLGALLWVTHADATIACFESKYFHLAWRPFSAINLAETDGNDATTAAPDWTPFLPTPPHPEYPAAHACVGAAAAESLKAFYGTPAVSYDLDSTASATTHHYDSTDALLADITVARIAGGMHFRSSVVDGAALGKSVADWTVSHRFQAR